MVVVTLIAGVALVSAGGKPGPTGTYKVIAYNDLGMHCACPGASTFLLLPPFNTIRAQVFLLTGATDPTVVSSGVNVSYSIVEDTKARLDADSYYQNWVAFSPKLFPGFVPKDASGNYVGLTGKKLADTMEYNSTSKGYEAAGIPAFPVVTNTSADIMTDPLGGANRDPYLTGTVYVKNSAGTILAQTNTTVPVAFGGCCTCHLTLAVNDGFTRDPLGSFKSQGKRHGLNSSKIDFSLIDPDGDGVGGPIRCSWCHWDPAMGESSAPGLANVWPNYTILPGANFTKADVKVSTRSFSDVLHKFHSQSTLVKTSYDANIAKNCYDCHPGNNVNCYRDAMKTANVWCTDCHGDLNQRAAAGQLTQPWQQSTLPTCNAPSAGATSAFACHNATTYPTPGTWTGLFGKYLNSRGHKGSIQCLTCHGSPHAIVPSTLAKDNTQTLAANANQTNKAIGVCTFCHAGSKPSTWGVPPHGKITR